jgi:hypothetical protein
MIEAEVRRLIAAESRLPLPSGPGAGRSSKYQLPDASRSRGSAPRSASTAGIALPIAPVSDQLVSRRLSQSVM